ncbi:hypothetical protein IDH70_04765 [Mixta calida]|nr:hypothetical protein IDH70_04765 [Mixta calida]
MNNQELAALCRIEIRRWQSAPDKQYMVDLLELALAALTAEAVKVPNEPTGGDAPSHLDEYEASCWVAGACWMRGKMLGHPDAIDNTAQQYEAFAKEDKC